jgi:putative flippase GtrA
MSSLIGRVGSWHRSPHFKRVLKFGTVSVISTVIAQTVLLLTFDVGHVASAMVCNVIATAVSTFPAYYLNRTWTWGKRGKSHLWREVAPFWILAFIGLVFSTLLVGLAAHNADRVSNSQEVKDLFVHGANFFAYGLIWVARYCIFNKYLFGPETHSAPAGGRAEEMVPATRPRSATPVSASATPVPVPASSTTTTAGVPAPATAPQTVRASSAGRLDERIS